MPGQFDLVAFGNPLLDMQIRDGEEVLKKVGVCGCCFGGRCEARLPHACEADSGHGAQYNLKSNDAILAEESHQVSVTLAR